MSSPLLPWQAGISGPVRWMAHLSGRLYYVRCWVRGTWRLPGTEQLLTEGELPSPSPVRSQPLARLPSPYSGWEACTGGWALVPSLKVRTLTGVPFRACLHSSVEQGGCPTWGHSLCSSACNCHCLFRPLPPPPPKMRGPLKSSDT